MSKTQKLQIKVNLIQEKSEKAQFLKYDRL